MASERELEEKFWSAVKSDHTLMLGLYGGQDGHTRPMTAQLDGERGPIWFFASRENALVQKLVGRQLAFATFASKGHDLFAEIHGTLGVDQDRNESTAYGTVSSPRGLKVERRTLNLSC